MAETSSHKQAKTQGLRRAKTELSISRGRRLDAANRKVAREVERSGNEKKIKEAIRRLNTQKTKKKELLVPTGHLDKAKEIGKRVAKGILRIQNLSRTKRRFVK